MRNVSELFKNIQNELIRPQMRLFFEVGSDLASVAYIGGSSDTPALDFDDSVAPIVLPKVCTNENFYAIVGDNVGVDNPNRICAPDDVSETPNVSVPMGVTREVLSEIDSVVIGSNVNYYENFIGIPPTGATICFVGGVVPDKIVVERYDGGTDTWEVEQTILNPDGEHLIEFIPADDEYIGSFRRFRISHEFITTRYQVSWVKTHYVESAHGNSAPVVFENNLISSVNIDMETDLTSQTLPSCEMTVECLDVDEIYTPESDYWKTIFTDGVPCYFKCGYETDSNDVEYVPLFYGKLTQAPDYDAGKLTFRVKVDLNDVWRSDFESIPHSGMNTGDGVVSDTFSNLISDLQLFDSYNVFHGASDEADSLCNYYGEMDADHARQLVANALGCFIVPGINVVDLHNTNDIQYKTYEDYLTRYEQVQNTLESQPKVGKIDISRYEYTLSADYQDIQTAQQVECLANDYVDCDYIVPFYAIGKFTVTNYNKTNSQATVTVDGAVGTGITEFIDDNGYALVTLRFHSNKLTKIRPTVRFYQVETAQYHEIEYAEGETGEVYENNNELITNGYVADKAKRVARIMSDMPNKYEVDVIQNYQYELGDVIRLETQKGVYKTCAITGLKYSFPGSNGHVTCRMIFSMLNCTSAVFNPKGVVFYNSGYLGEEVTTILTTDKNCIVVGIMRNVVGGSQSPLYVGQHLLYILGAVTVHRTFGAYDFDTNVTHYFTDLNGHEWGYFMIVCNPDEPITTTVPIVELPEYDDTETGGVDAFALTNLIRTIYSEQDMTAPVDYTCTTHEVTPPTP